MFSKLNVAAPLTFFSNPNAFLTLSREKKKNIICKIFGHKSKRYKNWIEGNSSYGICLRCGVEYVVTEHIFSEQTYKSYKETVKFFKELRTNK